MNRRRIGCVTGPNGHTLIWGPARSGKTWALKTDILTDLCCNRESWVIDPTGGLAGLRHRAHQYAHTPDLIRALLAAAGTSGPSGGPLTVTVDDARKVLDDPACRAATARIVARSPGNRVRLRMVSQDRDVRGYGWPAELCDALGV